MARVTLNRVAAHQGELPPVCIRCGADATDYRTKMFSLSPFGLPLIVLPFLIIFPGRIWVRAPFCPTHKNYWRWRLGAILAGLLVVVLLSCVGFPMMIDNASDHSALGRLGAFLCLGSFVGLLAWAVFSVVLQWTGIRIAGRGSYTITLAGVSEAFAEAVRQEDSQRPRIRR